MKKTLKSDFLKGVLPVVAEGILAFLLLLLGLRRTMTLNYEMIFIYVSLSFFLIWDILPKIKVLQKPMELNDAAVTLNGVVYSKQDYSFQYQELDSKLLGMSLKLKARLKLKQKETGEEFSIACERFSKEDRKVIEEWSKL